MWHFVFDRLFFKIKINILKIDYWLFIWVSFVPAERVREVTIWSGLRMCGCVWLTLLTLQVIGHRCYIHWLIMTNLGQDDHWVCPPMSHDFDLHLTFYLDKRVNAKFGRYTFYASWNSKFYFYFRDIITITGLLLCYRGSRAGCRLLWFLQRWDGKTTTNGVSANA